MPPKKSRLVATSLHKWPMSQGSYTTRFIPRGKGACAFGTFMRAIVGVVEGQHVAATEKEIRASKETKRR